MTVIAVILTVIFTVALFYALKKWYNNLQSQYPSINTQIQPQPSNIPLTDWTGSLNLDAQRYAVQNYCTLKGYDYEPPKDGNDYGHCLYNETTCKNDSNPHWVSCTPLSTGATGPSGGVDGNGKPCDLNERPYLEWHVDASGKGRCMISHFPPSFIQNVCEAKGLGGWYPSKLQCDASGYCVIDPNDPPTCYLTEDYCDKMGLDYSSSRNGIGDCTLSDWQNIVEGFAGKTVTRTFKKNTEAMIRECSDNPFSANCALSIGTELTTLDQIELTAVDTEFEGYMNSLRDNCGGDVFGSVDSFVKCGQNIFPGFFLTQQAVAFADGMLDGMLGWIPGMPSGLIGKALGYIQQYGELAAMAIFHAGEQAVQAFDIAGDAMANALSNIGLGGVGDVVRGVCRGVITFGKDMAGIVANVAKEALNIFANDIVPAAYHVFNAVVNAVLHPKDFFLNVAGQLENFVTDPIGTLKSAFKSIAQLGGQILDAAKAVINQLRNIASQLGDALKDLAEQLLDLAKSVEEAFKDIGNELKDLAEDIGGFFSSIF